MEHRPPITVSSLDAARLEKMLDSLDSRRFPNREDLQAELGRANIVEPAEMPPDVVTMNSTVTFRIESSGKDFSLTLVYPGDIGDGAEKVSILAPVGSALLGLREGDEISWPGPGGGLLQVRILKVVYQPERAGQFQR
ncbi:MAG: nucleoside diphosphate kinase regulator [Steroidobacteraceae bacterium]|nr:nucleoside diphosphate kinase regulator [Steroidobacteraceae bacterium]